MSTLIFWHICGINNWKEVTTEQKNTILNSGILNVVDKVNITYLGKDSNDINWLLECNPKFKLDRYDSYLGHWESLCLKSLYEQAINSNSNINFLFIHAKGVSKPNNLYVQEWRRTMEYHLITKYSNCLNLLKQYDAVGCFFRNEPKLDGGKKFKICTEKHKSNFSGNFWWTTSNHIKTLPNINIIEVKPPKYRGRYLLERWVLYKYPQMKIAEVYRHPAGLTHFYECNPF